VVQTRPEDTLQAGVELGEQAAYPVAGAGGFGREVLVEADVLPGRPAPYPDRTVADRDRLAGLLTGAAGPEAA